MSAVRLRRCELRDGAFQLSAGRPFNISPGDAPLSLGRREFPPLDSRVSSRSVNLTCGVGVTGALVITVENIGRHAVFISDIRYSKGGINATAIVPRGTTGILRLGCLLHLLPDAHYLYADGDGFSQCITASDAKDISSSPTVKQHPVASDASRPPELIIAPPSLPRDAPIEGPPSLPLLQHAAIQQYACMQRFESGLDDTLSVFGKDPATPEMACPWSREEILTKAGHLLRRFPWLQLNVPAPPSMADPNPTARCISLPHTPPPPLFSMGVAAGQNLNAHLTAHLVPLLDIYPVVLMEDEGVLDYKVKQIEEVVGALSHLPFRVESVEQIDNTPFLCGESTRKKIGEILVTKRLGLTEEYLKRPDVISKIELTKVGPSPEAVMRACFNTRLPADHMGARQDGGAALQHGFLICRVSARPRGTEPGATLPPAARGRCPLRRSQRADSPGRERGDGAARAARDRGDLPRVAVCPRRIVPPRAANKRE